MVSRDHLDAASADGDPIEAVYQSREQFDRTWHTLLINTWAVQYLTGLKMRNSNIVVSGPLLPFARGQICSQMGERCCSCMAASDIKKGDFVKQ